MKNLLNLAENRRLKFLEILSSTDEKVSLAELSGKLNASIRVLKEDIVYFRKNFTEFQLILSEETIQIIYEKNKGIKNIYQKFLSQSTAYQLLEAAFLHVGKSLEDLEDILFLSRSTLYRLVRKINAYTKQFHFEVQTNPVSIIGKEENIRSFFYQYIYEKYSFKFLPFFSPQEQKTLDDFLNFHLQMTHLKNDFAYFGKFKIIAAVNVWRFKQKHYVETDHIQLNFADGMPDLTPYADLFRQFEQRFNLKYDADAIKQIFTTYIDQEFSMNYEHLMQRAAKDKQVAAEVSKIREMFERLSTEMDIPITNMEYMVFAMRNIIHLPYLEPNPGYILYNRDQYFVEEMKAHYPYFYQSLYEAVRELRLFFNKPLTEDGLNFYMYTIFTYWKGLSAALRNKTPKIRTLVISDRHFTHARMIKEFIEFNFSELIEVDVYSEIDLEPSSLKDMDYDLIVSNFFISQLKSKRTLYIRNFPRPKDLKKLQSKFAAIREERLNESRRSRGE